MRYVGGYTSYLALLEDARAFEDVLTAMDGDADAATVIKLERGAKGGK